MASSKETYCLCGQPYNIGQFMIECDCCREWFHGSCVDVKVYQSDDIDKYHCPKCVQTYGPSVFKVPTNSHRADRYEIGAEARPPQAGTPAWVHSLAETPLRPTAAALQKLRPQQFTEEFIRDSGFNRPVIFHTTDGLDMKIPPTTFTVRSVLRYCGAQHDVEVIDVRKQSSIRMPLSEFVDYIETPPEHRDHKVLNVLSLEFSDTNLSPLVEPPSVLLNLDWTVSVWPAAEGRPPRPAVQKYCLMSAGGSYTDFHVDFGGTTVWYHVMHGRKIFYLIPPTSTNLALYQQWSSSPTQSEQFFGDLVEWYGTAELCAGQTLFIPSGWIHAVLTPRDSLVFGGNLLHSYAIEMQLQVYEIERRVETPHMFRYPLFEAMNWYAGVHLLSVLRRHNEEIQDEEFTISESCAPRAPAQLPALLLRGIKILSNALKEWHALKTSDPLKRENVPKCLNSGQLVRELCKELRTLEKRSASAANKDKDFKIKTNNSPNKSKKQQTPAKKSLKLTLPKPIMHMASQNGEFVEEKTYADKFYIDDKEIQYPERYVQEKYIDNKYYDNKYIENGKYVIENPQKIVDSNYKNTTYETNGKYIVQNEKLLVDGKYIIDNKDVIYQTYEELPFQDTYDKKTSVLKLKLNNPSSSSSPPPYPLPSHSILKSQLSRARPAQQWTISKKEGDFTEQLLYTNEHNRTDDPAYGPGMYSAEDIQQDYQYSETAKPGSYHPEYSYQQNLNYAYTRYEDIPPNVHQTASYTNTPAVTPAPVAVQETVINGTYHHNQLPSYDAAIAQQYHAPPPPEYQTVETKPCTPPPTGVRRSCRSSRRRVSSSYDYEDSELYIDTPPPATPRRKHRHQPRKQGSNNPTSSTYRASQPASQPPPVPVPAPAPAPPPPVPAPAPLQAPPTNGIESLIQASVLADGEPHNDNDNSDAAAAVAGMLSIGGNVPHHSTFGLATDSPTHHNTSNNTPSSSGGTGSKRRRTAANNAGGATSESEEDVIKEVHRDEEYVYPSLEMSSDEDEDWTVSRRRRNSRNRADRSKHDEDESWSPRGRLGRLVPRLRHAPRATRRENVRAALTHAATRTHTPAQPPAQPPSLTPQNAKRAVLATKSRRPPPPVQPTPNNKNSRLKKGMKTAKQRLGKILKIHKMIY